MDNNDKYTNGINLIKEKLAENDIEVKKNFKRI